MGSKDIGIPKGTRDFGPEVMRKRNHIFKTLTEIFGKYGFQQIETPALENLSTLLGKYGEEGDKLLFKILNSGNFLSATNDQELKNKNLNKLSTQICEKGLRYDLTVPFARYVVQHQNEIIFPFRRYQIQPVWRADRPQKGRYREFFQCDVDVIGSNSLLNEIELIQLIDNAFGQLKINVKIKINNRKILSGIAEITGESDKIADITVAIDKIEKIGIDEVNNELRQKGISEKAIKIIQPIIMSGGDNNSKIKILSDELTNSKIGLKGIEEINTIFDYLKIINVSSNVELDISLARGLNYYTGTIIEVKALEVEIGSICGGGRYDNLTGIFGLKNVSGVGISFGADRIYDVMNEKNLFENSINSTTKVLFINFGNESEIFCLKQLKKSRELGINAEIYPSAEKLKKQFQYANDKNIPYVIIVGDTELKDKIMNLKNMLTGEQKILTSIKELC